MTAWPSARVTWENSGHGSWTNPSSLTGRRTCLGSRSLTSTRSEHHTGKWNGNNRIYTVPQLFQQWKIKIFTHSSHIDSPLESYCLRWGDVTMWHLRKLAGSVKTSKSFWRYTGRSETLCRQTGINRFSSSASAKSNLRCFKPFFQGAVYNHTTQATHSGGPCGGPTFPLSVLSWPHQWAGGRGDTRYV